jgi:cell division protein FtsB
MTDSKADLLKRIEVLEKENNELANANSRYKTENHRLRDFNKEERLRSGS